ncbi:MAG TPA: hypothetical protein VGF48_06460 [Thermoanaerobaculia bacterium]|jgi:hypothetical protein
MPEFGSAAEKARQIASTLPFTDFVDFTTGLVRNVIQALHDTNREQLTDYITLVDSVAGTLAEFESKTFPNMDEAAREFLNNAVLPSYAGDADSKVLELGEVTTGEAVVLASAADKRAALATLFAGIEVNLAGTSTPKPILDHVDTAHKIAPAVLLDFAKAELRRTVKKSYAELQALVKLGIMRLYPEYALIRTTLLFEAESTDTSTTTTSTRESEYENRALNWGVNGSASYSQNKISKLVRSSFAAAISGGISSSRTNTKFKVATVDTKNSSNLETKTQITGFVEVKMRADFWPQAPQQNALPA